MNTLIESNDADIETQAAEVEGFRLSPQQRRFWSLQQACGPRPFRVCASVALEGRLDRLVLREAVHRVVLRHEILRTTFRRLPGMAFPVQVIHEEPAYSFDERDLGRLEGREQERAVVSLWEEARNAPFDLEQGPPLRVTLAALSGSSHLLIVSLPALSSDEAGLAVLLRDIRDSYAALKGGDEEEGEAEVLQYADIAEVLNELIESEEGAGVRETRAGQNSADPSVAQVPFESAAGGGQAFAPRVFGAALDAGLTGKLELLARSHEAGLDDVLQACWHILCWRLTGEAETTTGRLFSGRVYEGLDEVPGLFARYLPISSRQEPGQRFADVLAQVARAAEDACAGQDYFKWEYASQPQGREQSQSPFLPLGFEYVERPAAARAADLSWTVRRQESCTERFTLKLRVVSDEAEGLRTEFQYDAGRLTDARVERLARHYQTLLASVVTNETAHVGGLNILDEGQRRTVLHEFNRTAEDFGTPSCLHEYIEAQAARTPASTAVVFESEGLTYEELDGRVNQLARHLRRLGAGSETSVGVLFERGLEMLVGLLGVLKAGAAYIPLDPEYPQERLKGIVQDGRPVLLLTQERLRAKLNDLGAETPAVVCLDSDWGTIAAESTARVESGVTPENLAYIIYTSGSTGRPKGVEVSHRAICNRLLWMQRRFPLTPGDVLLQKTVYGFDASVWELFLPLMAGARVVMARPGGHRDAGYLIEEVRRSGVTVLQMVPSMLEVLLEERGVEECRGLRRVYCGGEALSERLRERFYERMGWAELTNLYGPTEASIDASYHSCTPGERGAGKAVPIGTPISNVQIYLLDGEMEPVPVGVGGELYIGGDGLARGYLNRAGLTAERFVPDPFGGVEGARLYRTGDLARYSEGGEIEYLGRADHQVKVRGFRIELGEIEAVLNGHPAVRQCVVVAREDAPGEKRLVAYVVGEDGESPAVAELRDYLKAGLPEYMVPQAFVMLERLPLTANGKLDRKALPPPEQSQSGTERAFAPPRTLIEETLANIWAEVLKLERVGVRDNFFELGGDSIRSIQVKALAQKVGLEFSLEQLFRYQTIQELARDIQESERGPAASPTTEPFGLISDEDRQKMPPEVEDAYPLAMLQAGMLFHREYSPGTAIYHDITSYHLKGGLDMDALRRAVAQLVSRHAILRTSFDLTSYSEPLQLVRETATIPLEEIDLRGLSEVEQAEALAAWIEAQKMRPFDASCPPLMRFTVHRRRDDSLQFTMNCHHAILDGWSVAAMVSELFQLYFSELGKELQPVGPPPSVNFRDFVALERQALESPESGEFWMRKLGDSTALRLPRWRESAPEGEGSHPFLHEVRLTEEVSEGLKRLARQAGVPVKSVLLAAHLRVMRLLGGQADVMTGVVTNCRLEESDGERALGLFLNTVPLRQSLSGGSWLDLVRETFAAEREMLPHRWFPLAEMQRRLGGRHLFEVVFNFVHFHVYESVSGFAEMEPLGAESFEQTNHPLTAVFSLEGPTQRVGLGLLCDATQLCEEQAEAISGYYVRALEAMAAAPERRYETAPLLSDAERRRMLYEWNETAGDYGLDNCLHRLIETQAALTPDAPAITFEGDTLSYARLNARANQLAHRLRSLGVGPDVPVGVLMERSLEMLAGLLAVLKAGGAYLPLDPDNPRERLSMVLEDAAPRLLLTQRRLQDALPNYSGDVLYLDGDWAAFESEPSENVTSTVAPENLAYVIYTSGSTGRPKGVEVSHRAICNRLLWMQRRFPLTPGDVLLQKTVYGFDASVWELFLPLMAGARVVMARPGGHRDSAYLIEEVRRSGVTVLQMVPSMLEVLLEERGVEECKSLRRVYCGGEALPERLRERFWERMGWAELTNLYGPTEASIDASYWPCEKGTRTNKVLIGRPISNVQLYLLDGEMEPVPVGVGGELYIGGDGLARGYLGRPSLTAERFVPDPFGGAEGGRLYRTGDVARFLPDGVIEYLGRVDQQVKVRGFRIELGEIEAALCEQGGVREAVVLAREEASGGKRLVAYVVPSKEEAGAVAPTAEELRQGLRGRLPDYMVPQALVMLERLPLLANGKLDARSLPEPDADWPGDEDTYVGPRTPVEEVVAGIWANALRVERVGIYDNFFDLGGHSLLATQVISRVRQVFQIELPLRTLFDEPTVCGLSSHVEAARRADLGLPAQSIRPVPREAALPLSFSQQRLWFLDQLEPGGAAYNVASAIRLKGALDIGALRQSLDALVVRHEVLRTTFSTVGGRPVQIVGRAEPVEVPVVDLQESPEAEKASRVRTLTGEEAQRPFDLTRGPLLRVMLLRLGGDEHVMLLTMHHIVSDGWSLGVLVRELSSLYEAFSSGQSPRLEELPVQYADFAAWQRGWLDGEVLETQLDYWRRHLADAPAVSELPTDRPRPAVQSVRGVNLHTTVSKSTTEALKALSRREGASLFMTLLGAFQVLVGRQARRERVVVGTDVANRNRDEVEGLIGFFANQLVLHTDLSGDPEFLELLGRVREVTLGAYAHQDLPFDKLVEVLRPERDPSRTPLFQLKIVMQNAPMPTLELPGLSLTSEEVGGGTAKFDLTLFLEETEQGLSCTWQYNSDLFEAATMRRLAEHFALLLDNIALQPKTKLGELTRALDAAEREERLDDKRRLEAANFERFKSLTPRAVRAG